MLQRSIPSHKWLVLLLFVVLTPALYGCSPDPQQQASRCDFEFQGNQSSDVPISRAETPDVVVGCMTTQAYVEQFGCKPENVVNAYKKARNHPGFCGSLIAAGRSGPTEPEQPKTAKENLSSGIRQVLGD